MHTSYYKTILQIHGHAFSLNSENNTEVIIQILNVQAAIAEKNVVKWSRITCPDQHVTYFCIDNNVEPQQTGGSISRLNVTFLNFLFVYIKRNVLVPITFNTQVNTWGRSAQDPRALAHTLFQKKSGIWLSRFYKKFPLGGVAGGIFRSHFWR